MPSLCLHSSWISLVVKLSHFWNLAAATDAPLFLITACLSWIVRWTGLKLIHDHLHLTVKALMSYDLLSLFMWSTINHVLVWSISDLHVFQISWLKASFRELWVSLGVVKECNKCDQLWSSLLLCLITLIWVKMGFWSFKVSSAKMQQGLVHWWVSSDMPVQTLNTAPFFQWFIIQWDIWRFFFYGHSVRCLILDSFISCTN